MTTITSVNKSSLVNAIFNYLQKGRYHVDFESCGTPSKDDQAIADSINLKEITKEQIAEIIADEYMERLPELDEVTIEGITKAVGVSLCSAWITGQPHIKGNYFQLHREDGDLLMGEYSVYRIY